MDVKINDTHHDRQSGTCDDAPFVYDVELIWKQSSRVQHERQCLDKAIHNIKSRASYMYYLELNTHAQWCSGSGATGAIVPVPLFQGGVAFQFLFHLIFFNFAYIWKKLTYSDI